MTFDGPPQVLAGTGLFTEEYYEAGMQFNLLGPFLPGGGVLRVSSGYYPWPDNGTAYLVGSLASTNTLAFSFSDGALFGLLSVDLAEYTTTQPGAVTMRFVGYRHDGGIVNAGFTADGINDGTGPLEDFQTFYFGPEFTGLDRVEIPSHGWSLDNLVISTIPEPSSLALLGCGGVLLARHWLRRFRKRE